MGYFAGRFSLPLRDMTCVRYAIVSVRTVLAGGVRSPAAPALAARSADDDGVRSCSVPSVALAEEPLAPVISCNPQEGWRGGDDRGPWVTDGEKTTQKA